MTIDEAITYHNKVAHQQIKNGFRSQNDIYDFLQCAKEHKQHAEWLEKLKEYQQLEEHGRLIKLPVKDDTTGHRECVHIKSACYHEDYKCSECPLTELFCDEFYKAIDRCYEEAYASGCLAGIELGKSEAEAKLKELR